MEQKTLRKLSSLLNGTSETDAAEKLMLWFLRLALVRMAAEQYEDAPSSKADTEPSHRTRASQMISRLFQLGNPALTRARCLLYCLCSITVCWLCVDCLLTVLYCLQALFAGCLFAGCDNALNLCPSKWLLGPAIRIQVQNLMCQNQSSYVMGWEHSADLRKQAWTCNI